MFMLQTDLISYERVTTTYLSWVYLLVKQLSITMIAHAKKKFTKSINNKNIKVRNEEDVEHI